MSLEGFKETSANNIINSVNNSKNNDLSKLIFALGIRHIGAKAGKLLADYFKDIDLVMVLPYSSNGHEAKRVEGRQRGGTRKEGKPRIRLHPLVSV